MIVGESRRGEVQRKVSPCPTLVAFPAALVQKSSMGRPGGRADGLRWRFRKDAVTSVSRRCVGILSKLYLASELRCRVVRRARMCRISEQHQGDRFGDLLGEGVVKDQRVVPTLIVRYIVGTLDDLVRFALANPSDLLEADTGQLFNDRGSRTSGSSGRR